MLDHLPTLLIIIKSWADVISFGSRLHTPWTISQPQGCYYLVPRLSRCALSFLSAYRAQHENQIRYKRSLAPQRTGVEEASWCPAALESWKTGKAASIGTKYVYTPLERFIYSPLVRVSKSLNINHVLINSFA